MSKKFRKLLQITGILLLFLCGCARKDALQEEAARSDSADTDSFLVYCTNSEGTKLNTVSVRPEAENFEGIVKELLANFADPKGDENFTLLQDGTAINSYSVGVDTLTVDFNAAYLGLSNVREILLRAGIVKTLVRVPGIIFVQITVDGQPITESSGEKIGPMNEDTFVSSKGDAINSYRQTDIKLYFPDTNGEKLIAEDREAVYSTNVIPERVIVEKIIEGPKTEGVLPVTSSAVEINSVKVNDGICTIDLDIGFNQTYDERVTPEACLYAFVNSIVEQCDCEKVRFLIDGSDTVRFRGQINLEQLFTRDVRLLDYDDLAETEQE